MSTVVVVVAEELRHNMEKQEVHKLGEHCRTVHSSIGLYSSSWTYLGLDFSPQVVDSAIEGFCNPSLTYMHHGFSPLSTHCIALPLPFGQYSNSVQVHVEN